MTLLDFTINLIHSSLLVILAGSLLALLQFISIDNKLSKLKKLNESAVWNLLQVLSYLANGGIESESTISADFISSF